MHKAICAVSFAGLAFSGYISGTKLLSGGCAFNEPCPYVFGIPACYIGFVLFVLLAIYSVLLVTRVLSVRAALTLILTVALVGTGYAGYLTIPELPLLFSQGFGAYALGLPTCALGFVCFTLVAVLAYGARRRS